MKTDINNKKPNKIGLEILTFLLTTILILFVVSVLYLLGNFARTYAVEQSMNDFCDQICESSLRIHGHYKNEFDNKNECYCITNKGELRLNLSKLKLIEDN